MTFNFHSTGESKQIRLREWLSAVARFFVVISVVFSSLLNDREYPKYEGFSSDVTNMRGDWQTIGNDMRKVLKNEKSSREAAGRKYG